MLYKKLLASFVLLAVTATAYGQKPSTPKKEPTTPPSGGIAWHGQWSEGVKIARKTGRPILLIAAAPHCKGISGIW